MSIARESIVFVIASIINCLLYVDRRHRLNINATKRTRCTTAISGTNDNDDDAVKLFLRAFQLKMRYLHRVFRERERGTVNAAHQVV